MTPNLPIDPAYEDRDCDSSPSVAGVTARAAVVAIFLLAAIYGLIAACLGQTLPSPSITIPTTRPAPLAYGITRQTLYPGGKTLIWTRGTIATSFLLVNSRSGVFTPKTSTPEADGWSWDDAARATVLTLPTNIPSGTYALTPTGLYVTVIARPATRPTTRVSSDFDNDDRKVQAAIDAGYSPLLMPGVYDWRNAVHIPGNDYHIAGVDVDAVILKRAQWASDPVGANYGGRFFYTDAPEVDDLSLTDLTFKGGEIASGALAFHSANSVCQNLECKHCKLVSAIAPLANMPGAVVDDLDIFRGGARPQTHSYWHDIRFHGVFASGNECLVYGDQIAMLNISFDGTGRGPILRGLDTNGYFNTISGSNINLLDNGDEFFSIESTLGFNGNIVSHLHLRASNGALLECWHTPAVDNLFQHLDADCGGGILFDESGAIQTRNALSDVELSHCKGLCFTDENGVTATGNTVNGLAIVAPNCTRSNQAHYSAAYYPAHPQAITGAAGNTITNFSFSEMPANWLDGIGGK